MRVKIPGHYRARTLHHNLSLIKRILAIRINGFHEKDL